MEVRTGFRKEFRLVSPERRTRSGIRCTRYACEGAGSHLLTEQYWVWFRVRLKGETRLGLRIRPGPRGRAKHAEKRYGASARVLGRLNGRP